MDQSIVAFKVYLTQETNQKLEVRRFQIYRNLVTSFSNLKEKLQLVFPVLKGTSFEVFWKDSEGDDVIISSDEELVIALNEMRDDICKLFVELKTADDYEIPFEQECGNPEGPAVHYGVSCDGCEKQIEGFRYKCLMCPDYDLCAVCEGRGIHPEHVMIRLSRPVKWRQNFGRRLAHHLSKAAHKSAEAENRDSRHKRWRHHKGGPSMGHCPWTQQGQALGRNFVDYIGQYLNDWSNPQGTTNPGANTNGNEQNQQNHEEYLRNIGKTVANLLSPLGVEVDIDVRHPKDSSSTSTAQNTSTGAAHASNNDENGKKTTFTGGDKSTNDETAKKFPFTVPFAVSPGANDESGKKSPFTVITGAEVQEKMDVDQVKLPSAPSMERQSPDPVGWTLINKQAEPSSNVQTSTTPPSISGAIPKQVDTVSQAELSSLYPRIQSLTTDSTPYVSSNPKVMETLTKLQAMGFTNEGGWLSQLVEIKRGNIEQVLDVLLPVKK